MVLGLYLLFVTHPCHCCANITNKTKISTIANYQFHAKIFVSYSLINEIFAGFWHFIFRTRNVTNSINETDCATKITMPSLLNEMRFFSSDSQRCIGYETKKGPLILCTLNGKFYHLIFYKAK